MKAAPPKPNVPTDEAAIFDGSAPDLARVALGFSESFGFVKFDEKPKPEFGKLDCPE